MSAGKLKVTAQDGVTVIQLGEEYNNLDEAALEKATTAILDATAPEDVRLVLFDMSRTRFFGSAFLGTLFRVWRRLTARGGRIAVCSANEMCREVFEVTQTHRLWPQYDDREAAVRDLTSH